MGRVIPPAVAALSLMAAAACSSAHSTAPAAPPAIRLAAYDTCRDLLTGLRSAAAKQVGPWGLGGPLPVYAKGAVPAEGLAAAAPAPQHSETNVQEAGVDEPDTVKTDGRRIVTVTGDTLRVIDPAARKVTGTLRLPGPAYDPQILLDGDHALVIARPVMTLGGMVRSPGPGGLPFAPDGDATRLLLVDLTSKPTVTATLTFRGGYLDARQIGSVARVVVRSTPKIDFPGGNGTLQQLTDANRKAVANAPLSAWLPSYEVDSGGRKTTHQVPCGQVSHPRDYTGTSLVTVFTVDLSAGLGDGSPVSVVADGGIVYASPSALYLAHTATPPVPEPVLPPEPGIATPGRPVPGLPARPPGRPAATPAAGAPSAVPPAPAPPAGSDTAAPPAAGAPPAPAASGKPAGAASAGAASAAPAPPGTAAANSAAPNTVAPAPVPVTTAPVAEPVTEIHEFDISGSGRPRYVASGKVPGEPLSAYSLSEYAGNLRVATTESGPRGDVTAVHVLTRHGGLLGETGSVGGLGQGQRVYAVRFLGTRGYVVTFRQMDPLYTLDLSDPAHPRPSGALELNGYSAYLHPVADGRLLGVGQDATGTGHALGTQVSLFDVSGAPKRLAAFRLPDSRSAAEYDPHAFLYWPQSGLTVLPVTVQGQWAAEVLALTVTPQGVRSLGTIRHPGDGIVPIERSLLIGSTLWTFSGSGAEANDATTLARQSWLPYT